MKISYEEYIASKEWKRKREARFEIDGNKCRLCDEDGDNYRLEVHHRPSSYPKIPNESIEDDLITLCSLCHDFVTNIIREKRYGNKKLKIVAIEEPNIEREEIDYGIANSKIQVDFIVPNDNAQRANSESPKQVVKITEEDYEQAKKDRCRS